MKKIYFPFLLFALLTSNVFGQAFVKWTFDSSNNTPLWDNTGNTASLLLLGGITSSYVSGNPGQALNTTSYPVQGSNSGTAGIQLGVSTTTRTGIIIGFDLRLSNTASKYYQVQYSANGSTFTTLDLTVVNASGPSGSIDIVNDVINAPADNNFYSYTFDLSSLPPLDNNTDFAIRIVSVFAPGTFAYAPVSGTYSTIGTVRFDNIIIGQNSTLPIRLTYFKANVTSDNKTQLFWETASEQNFSHFVIERGLNGTDFTNIQSIPASRLDDGDTYSFIDDWTYDGSIYYRLRIVNENNLNEYGPTVRVDMKQARTDNFMLSPNPANNLLSVQFSKMESGDIIVYDFAGRVVAHASLNGIESMKIVDVSRLQKGNYMVAFYGANGGTIGKFTKI